LRLREDSLKEEARNTEKVPLSKITRIKREKTNIVYGNVLGLLVKLLERLGYVVKDNIYVDAFTRLVSGPTIFEVKSITRRNELSQCRQGLSQLYP